jgi:hypothetical protein
MARRRRYGHPSGPKLYSVWVITRWALDLVNDELTQLEVAASEGLDSPPCPECAPV